MDAYKKTLGLCNRAKEKICAKKEKGVSVVERRKRRSMRVYLRTIEEEAYQTLKVISNCTSIFCRKEEWEKEDGSELSIFK